MALPDEEVFVVAKTRGFRKHLEVVATTWDVTGCGPVTGGRERFRGGIQALKEKICCCL